jgi:hypothetical protein
LQLLPFPIRVHPCPSVVNLQVREPILDIVVAFMT